MLGLLITSMMAELHQLSSYWSKKSKRPRSFQVTFINDSVLHYQSRDFDFLHYLSTNLSATLIKLCQSVNSLWIWKINRWFNQFFVIVERRQVISLLRDKNYLLLTAFQAAITKINFTNLIISANVSLIVSSSWNKASFQKLHSTVKTI